MNKIRVCAFLALVVFIGSVVTDMFSGFMDGWNEAGDQKDFHALPSVSLLVRADDTLPADTLISAAQDTPMYCNTSEVSVQGFRSTKWRWVSFLLFPAGLFALYGFYSVARLVLTATKGEVFVHKNVRRMRIFVYALISVSLLFELQQWGIYHDTEKNCQQRIVNSFACGWRDTRCCLILSSMLGSIICCWHCSPRYSPSA